MWLSCLSWKCRGLQIVQIVWRMAYCGCFCSGSDWLMSSASSARWLAVLSIASSAEVPHERDVLGHPIR